MQVLVRMVNSRQVSPGPPCWSSWSTEKQLGEAPCSAVGSRNGEGCEESSQQSLRGQHKGYGHSAWILSYEKDYFRENKVQMQKNKKKKTIYPAHHSLREWLEYRIVKKKFKQNERSYRLALER